LGAAVPGAAVTITDIGTNEKHTAQSDSAGDYRFVSLVPAVYKVEVQKSNFKRFVRDRAPVQVSSTTRVDVALQVGEVTETVEVTTQAPLLQTDSGTLGTVVEGKTVEEMPLNGRNTMNLLALDANIVPGTGSTGATTLNTGGHTNTNDWGNFSIGGGQSNQSAMYVDGAPLNMLGGNTVGYVPTQDSVQEFNVSTNSASAEYGRYSGGVVNMTTKSGTNKWHGSAYEYLRNNVLNANEWWNKNSEYSGAAKAGDLTTSDWNKRAQWDQNQYGVVFDGPIKKDKIFFLFSWEAFAARTASVNNQNVPTADMQAGIIDGASSTTAAYVQSVCSSATYSAGNLTIPQGCWDPTAAVMKTEWPGEHNATANYNYNLAGSTGTNTDSYTGRVDYNLSANQRLFGRYTDNHIKDLAQEPMPGGTYNGKAWNIGGGATVDHTQSVVFGDTYTLNQSTILDLRLSYMRAYSAQTPPTAGMDMSIFGSNWGALAKTMSATNIPSLNFGNDIQVSGFRGSNQLSYQWNDTDGFTASLTKILGNHSLKFGAEDRYSDRAILNLAGQNQAGGSLSFGASNGRQFFTGNSWSDFLLGFANSGTISTVREVGSFNLYQGYYANDTWQATRKMTVTAGLRWELLGNVKEKRDRAQVLLPNATATVMSSSSLPLGASSASVYGSAALVNSSAYTDRGTEPSRHDLFAPHVGFAYRLTSNDVVRGGYGYNLVPPDSQTGMFPDSASMNSLTTTWSKQTNNVNYLLSNPFPTSVAAYANGIPQPVGRSGSMDSNGNPTSSFLSLENTLAAPVATTKFAYTEQWNLSVSHQFKGNLMLEVGYAATVATHTPMGYDYDELTPAYWTDQTLPQQSGPALPSGSTLTSAQLTACNNVWGAGTTTLGQCARPYSAYTGYNDVIGPVGTSQYNSMPVRLEKRFKSGGVLTGSYTWAKTMSTTSSPQDWYNLKANRAIDGSSVGQRFVGSYVANLPFGKGEKYFANVNSGIVRNLISGWAVNGITTLQQGQHLTITGNEATSPANNTIINIPTTYGAGTLRPNYTPGATGCTGKVNSGSIHSHVLAGTAVLNSSCFTAPGYDYSLTTTQNSPFGPPQTTTEYYATTLGNESPVDSQIKADGIINFDFSAVKSTKITEKVSLEFRMEFFNIFNRTQFAAPATAINPANGSGGGGFGGPGGPGGGTTPFGVISSALQSANPRQGQASLRLSF
jgi:hypothetical protein